MSKDDVTPATEGAAASDDAAAAAAKKQTRPKAIHEVETISKEEMKARFEQARARRAADRADRAARRAPQASLVRMGATALAATIGVGLLAVVAGTSGGHEDKVAENSARIVELRENLASEQTQADNLPDAEVLKSAMAAAADKGRAVMDSQLAMVGLGDMQVTDDDKLEEYGRMTDDAKRFYTQGAVSQGDFLPHGKWYQPHKPGVNEDGRPAWVPLAPEEWTWHLVPTWEVNPDGTVPVIWEARLVGGERDGALMAWVIGSYDSRRGLFSDMRLGHTPEGYERIGATTSPEIFGAHADDLMPVPEESEIIAEARAAVEAENARREEEERQRQREEFIEGERGEPDAEEREEGER